MAEGKFTRETRIALVHPHTALPVDVTLTETDAMAIFEELLEAMNQAYMLGLKLNRSLLFMVTIFCELAV